MNPWQERRYYVDFRESGGAVHSKPTRMLPELVLTGKTRSQLDIELEEHAKIVGETLGESAQKGRRLDKTVGIAKSRLLDLYLPFPGLIELKDNFYTGWFYSEEEGRIYSVFRNREEGIPVSYYPLDKGKSAYFLLDKEEAQFWNEKIRKRKLLTIEEMDSLFSRPDLYSHPSFENLKRLNLKQLTETIQSAADNFWGVFETFDRNDRSDAKGEFLRKNLLDLEILNRAHKSSHSAAQAEIRESMEKSEITVFPLGNEGCVARYRTDSHPKNYRQTSIRTLPLPHNLIRHFQRYGRLRELPMTKEEFEALYRKLVDPNTKLSF